MATKKPRPITPEKRIDAARKIRAFHDLGELVLARAEKDKVAFETAAALVAKDMSVDIDGPKKAGWFADRCEENDAELDQISEPCMKSGNNPLTVTHVRLVLGITDRVERLGWLTRAAENGWTTAKLAEAIRTSKAT